MRYDSHVIFLLFMLMIAVSCRQTPAPLRVSPVHLIAPDIAYAELFADVQEARIFPDSKTFPDCIPLDEPEVILARYRELKAKGSVDLQAFVNQYFKLPSASGVAFQSDLRRSINDHIENLWPVLTRQPDSIAGNVSLIPLPHPFVVPGGRFREVYYWDTYFTCLGLQASKTSGYMVKNMTDNFAWLIDTIGFVPNGTRTYYLSRSQPPFFSLMVRLVEEMEGPQALDRYLPALEKEYTFWMQEEAGKEASLHVVHMPDGEVLNRFWDRRPAPRTESYREDVELARTSGRNPEELYSHIRAACESGWDFSSRWFADGATLATIHTTDIIPVDLNSLMYQMEQTISDAWMQRGDTLRAGTYRRKAEARKAAILKYCWDPALSAFTDYDFAARRSTGILSLAGMYPLCFQIADQKQADLMARLVKDKFLRPGGVVSTLAHTGQQWDAPNGWAPLQWMTIQGLRNYGHTELATEIRSRWIQLNEAVYRNTGKLVEKYNVETTQMSAGGGEYPLQDGFGWTNGVLLRLLNEAEK